MKNEFIELVSLWTRFPCGAWLMKSCFIRYLVAYGFAWSDIWLRLHSCLLIRSCSESYVGYKAKFLGFDHEKRVLSRFFDHEKRVHWTCFSLNSFSLWCLILTKFPWFAWSYNELIELVFHVWKHKCRRSQISDQANPQAAKYLIKQDFINQAPQGKRVQRETSSISLKLYLTYNIVWVLWLFFLKTL